MYQLTLRRWFRHLPAAAIYLAAALAMQSSASAQQVVVLVNGSPITAYDIEQRGKLMQLSGQKNATRQEIIDDLINEKIKVQEARKYQMGASDAEVERAVASVSSRTGMNVAQFTQALASSGVNISTLTSRLRAEITWSQLVRAKFPSSLQIEDKDVRDVLETKKEPAESVSYDYKLRPIVFIVPKGSAASVVEGRMREAEGLRLRFQGCDEGIALARGLRDIAVRDTVTRTSADLPPALREVLNTTAVGKLTKPEATAQGVEVFALCEKNENTTDTPQKRGARQEIFSSRFDVQSKRYLSEVRRAAMIEYK